MDDDDELNPPRRFLLLATTGGFTHATPVLEIGAVLASRGHEIQFATNTGQGRWAKSYPFISLIHNVGPPIPDDATDLHYERMRVWRAEDGMGPMMQSRRLFDASWTETYRHLKAICQDPYNRPDFIIADFFAEAAARDMLQQFGIQIAVVWPQMPYFMAQSSYVPGQPGFQVDVTLTSEHASILSRFRNELVVVKAIPALLSWNAWTKKMRSAAGVNYPLRPLKSPNYLVLVNSFFGLEVPKQLPPLLAAVGPILQDHYPQLDWELDDFLSAHSRVLYISLGTHVALPTEDLDKVMRALVHCLDTGHLDGVVWSIASKPRTRFDSDQCYPRANGSEVSVEEVLAGEHPDFFLPHFAPQRAILDHPSTKLFLTHGGGSSANEATFHGVPVVAIGYFFDQLCNSVRLRDAGVGISLDKSTFDSVELASAIRDVLDDRSGSIRRNVLRMKRIARAASNRKHYAADLIEEVMYDQELRLYNGKELRPMHLQTADARMPLWKVYNWDMWFVGFSSFAVLGVSCWWTLRRGRVVLPQAWSHLRDSLLPRATSYLRDSLLPRISSYLEAFVPEAWRYLRSNAIMLASTPLLFLPEVSSHLQGTVKALASTPFIERVFATST